MVDVYEISAVVAAVGVLIGLVYYILDMRNQSRIRQTDLVMRLYSIFGSKECMEAHHQLMTIEANNINEFMKKYSGLPERLSFGTVCAFYEGIGVLLHRRLIDISLVDDLFSTSILQTWEKIEHLVKDLREHQKRPQIWEWFEYLYNEMKKREQQLAKA
jgi:hypothetical protein